MSSPTLKTQLEAARLRPRFGRIPSVASLLSVVLARSNRSVALGVVAAASGLALAAVGVFHSAPQRDLNAPPPGDVALVNGQPILMSDFMDETQKAAGVDFASATPAQRATQLRSMINDELLVQRALALNLPEEDIMVRESLMEGVNNQIANSVLANPPSEDTLRSYFASHHGDYASKGSMNYTELELRVGGFENVDQSVSQAMADAAQAVYELRSGTPVDQIQQHFSMQVAGNSGESLDFAAQIYLGPKLFAVAQTLSDGQISDPVVLKDGVHVLVMHRRVAPVPATFDAVRNNVYFDYLKAEETREQQTMLKYLQSTARIVLAPGQSE